MSTLPSLFLSHGAPTLPLTDAPARAFLSGLGGVLTPPKAILMVSAHWETAVPTVSAGERNETIHDFQGFPRALYEMKYNAPGSPAVAARVADLLRIAGIDCNIDRSRGLEHGAWVPLLLMYPHANIPVLQLSIQPHRGPQHHLDVGRALAALRLEACWSSAAAASPTIYRNFAVTTSMIRHPIGSTVLPTGFTAN